MIHALAICGPTASGKTELSLELASRLDGEIICCDSMQIYKYMDIGTAKPTLDERGRISHYLVDFVSPDEDYSAERYRIDAMCAATDITERKKLPIFVGGTGLYLDTLMRGAQSEVPKSDARYRESELAKIKTPDDAHALWEKLKSIDPRSAEAIHENNTRRVIRAIEIYEKTGKPKSYFDELSKTQNSDISLNVITLDFYNRQNLYERVDKRVDKMMSAGLLSEVSELYSRGFFSASTTAAQAIGYKELVAYIKGELSFGEAVELIKQSSRRYAKRQLTWFRHTNAHRIMLDCENGKLREYSEIIEEAYNLAKQKNTI